MDTRTAELRAAHDVLAPIYADRLANALDEMPLERSLLSLFCELIAGGTLGTEVADVGCGTGRLTPFLTAHGVHPRGIDLSPEMIRIARRDHPGISFDEADLRRLPFADASLAGVVCWYSLIYLEPSQRPQAFAELARVINPGGYLATAFKAGDDGQRRAGRALNLGIGFDLHWISPERLQQQFVDAGFRIVCWAGRPAEPDELQPQGYLLVQKT